MFNIFLFLLLLVFFFKKNSPPFHATATKNGRVVNSSVRRCHSQSCSLICVCSHGDGAQARSAGAARNSLVGTPNYMAPEICSRAHYGRECDWWSLGVIMYELLTRTLPFEAASVDDTIRNVVDWRNTLRLPQQVSPAARDVLARLLCEPDSRLGRNGLADFKVGCWFCEVQGHESYVCV